MINCKDSIDRLLHYLDGDLSDEVRAELEEHFGDCEPCEEFLATYRATPELCRTALATKMPEALATKLTAFLHAHLASHRRG